MDELYPHIVDKAGLEESLRWLLRTAGEKGGCVQRYITIGREKRRPPCSSPIFSE
ncbi:hypothetical protein [Paenibacillus dendritiformis]|uniref:hypothetical protein n=1 Tax=Paenibacillus dendritiformis TaxID=130049 RepID=UPI0018CD34FC|nr:hypothetical protein [Paenibacillus dendritiformis]